MAIANLRTVPAEIEKQKLVHSNTLDHHRIHGKLHSGQNATAASSQFVRCIN